MDGNKYLSIAPQKRNCHRVKHHETAPRSRARGYSSRSALAFLLATFYFTSADLMSPMIGGTRDSIYPMFAVKLLEGGAPAGLRGTSNRRTKPCISSSARMQLELEILRDVTSRLAAAGIHYMLTGSFALNYYAQPRMTRDIDLVVSLESSDADKVLELFTNDYYIDRQAVTRAIVHRSLFNIIHLKHIVKVDFIVRKNTEYDRVEFDRRRIANVENIELYIISKEDLLISKLLWARDSHSEFQLRDVRNLLMSDYDAGYVETWTEKLELKELLRECLNE
jgi:hypothetical protein